MLAPILIFLACHLFLLICLAISWQLLETDNGRQNFNNHHLRDFQPELDSEGRPQLRIPWVHGQTRRIPWTIHPQSEEEPQTLWRVDSRR